MSGGGSNAQADGYVRKMRRTTIAGDAGFTTFTSGIKVGWHAEFASRKFRQAVCAEFIATFIFVAVGSASVVFTHQASQLYGMVEGLNYTESAVQRVQGGTTAPGRGLGAWPEAGAAGPDLATIAAEQAPALPSQPWLGRSLADAAEPSPSASADATVGELAQQVEEEQVQQVQQVGQVQQIEVGAGVYGSAAERTERDAWGQSTGKMLLLALNFPMPRWLSISLTFGLMITVLVFSTGSISGGNINPAVTVSLFLTRKMSSFRASCYVTAQCLGAICGAAFIKSLSPDLFDAAGGAANAVNTDSKYISMWTAIGGEFLGTALLVFTVCAAADVGREKNNKYTGALTPLMLGFAVLCAHLFLIPVDGCSINPARSFGSAVVSGKFKDHWVFWLGPMLGGPCAALLYDSFFKLPNLTLPSPSPGLSAAAGDDDGGGIDRSISLGGAAAAAAAAEAEAGAGLLHRDRSARAERAARMAAANAGAGTGRPDAMTAPGGGVMMSDAGVGGAGGQVALNPLNVLAHTTSAFSTREGATTDGQELHLADAYSLTASLDAGNSRATDWR